MLDFLYLTRVLNLLLFYLLQTSDLTLATRFGGNSRLLFSMPWLAQGARDPWSTAGARERAVLSGDTFAGHEWRWGTLRPAQHPAVHRTPHSKELPTQT